MLKLKLGDWRAEAVTLGVGYNWFDYLGRGGFYARNPKYPLNDAVYPALEDVRGWEAVYRGLDELAPGVIRFGIPSDQICDEGGKFQVDGVHWERLRRLAGWAKRAGAIVVLDTFLIPEVHEMKPLLTGSGSGMVNMAPANNERYAQDFIAPLLRQVCEDKLDAVRYFNPVNEAIHWGVFCVTPEKAGKDPEAADLRAYVAMYRAMRSALDEAGVKRDRIGLIGFDGYSFDLMLIPRMHALGLDLDPYVDAYSIHYYNHRFDYLLPGNAGHSAPIGVIHGNTASLVDYCNRRGKPLFAMEIGTFHYGWREHNPSGAASHDACLTVAEAVIRGLTAGLQGAAFWCVMNPNTIDGWWRVFGVKDGEVERSRSPWAIYGMLSKWIRPGARIAPVDVSPGGNLQHVHGLGVQNPDGTKVFVLINDHPTDNMETQISLPEGWSRAEWAQWVSDRVRLNEKVGAHERPGRNDGTGIIVSLPAFSLSVLV